MMLTSLLNWRKDDSPYSSHDVGISPYPRCVVLRIYKCIISYNFENSNVLKMTYFYGSNPYIFSCPLLLGPYSLLNLDVKILSFSLWFSLKSKFSSINVHESTIFHERRCILISKFLLILGSILTTRDFKRILSPLGRYTQLSAC